jgi:hypothetical protein
VGQGKERYRQKKSIKPLVFETSDRWGSSVVCTQSNWETHIVAGHPELLGREDDVRKTIEDPDRVSPSTLTGRAFGHEKTMESETIRAIVYYDNPSLIFDGTTTAQVGTAYIVDTVNYSSRVGSAIYVKSIEKPETEKNGGEAS